MRSRWVVVFIFMFALAAVAWEVEDEGPTEEISTFRKVLNFLWVADGTSYHHVWPPMEFGWQIVVGSLIGFFGSAFGSVGGVGGGGIYVPMLALIIGFDPKSSTAISKCMITGAAGSTVYYNLRIFSWPSPTSLSRLDLTAISNKTEGSTGSGSAGMITGAAGSTVYYNLRLRHPTINMPIIDYNLALLIQPMLILGISIGVIFNVVFPDWLVTVLLICLFMVTSTRAFLKGVETWKKETTMKNEAARRAEANVETPSEGEYTPIPTGPNDFQEINPNYQSEVPILENVCWRELGLLVLVWIAFLVLQITKNYVATCSIWYWLLNFMQIPVAVGVSGYEALNLYRGKTVIASQGDTGKDLKIHQLVFYCSCGITAGIVGGLLGLGGGFILGPLFVELGITPQVSSATATFAMTFSASMSVVEYYLLHRFPVPYALYFIAVATVAAFAGQHVVRKLIILMGRESLIIFILSFTIFVSAISLGGVGISNIFKKIEHHEYMGFENLCMYRD